LPNESKQNNPQHLPRKESLCVQKAGHKDLLKDPLDGQLQGTKRTVYPIVSPGTKSLRMDQGKGNESGELQANTRRKEKKQVLRCRRRGPGKASMAQRNGEKLHTEILPEKVKEGAHESDRHTALLNKRGGRKSPQGNRSITNPE